MLQSDVCATNRIRIGLAPNTGVGHEQDVRIDLKREALISEEGETARIFGRWDTLFGCWVRRNRNPIKTPALPFDPLDHAGIPRDLPCRKAVDPDGTRETIPNRTWAAIEASAVSRQLGAASHVCTAQEAWKQYLSEVPSEVRACAAGCTGMQWIALEAIWFQPELLKMLSDGDSRRFAMAVFHLAEVRRASLWTLKDRQRLYAKLAFEKREQLLAGVLGPGSWRRFVRLVSAFNLPKREPTAFEDSLNRQHLMNLFALAESGRATSYVLHAQTLNSRVVSYAGHPDVPESWKRPTVLHAISESWDVYSLLVNLAELMALHSDPALKKRVHQSIQSVRGAAGVIRCAKRWLAELSKSVRFPEPEVGYRPPLRPLRSFAELVAEGEECGNCLASCPTTYAADIMQGHLSIFAWEGVERATISVRKYGGRWTLGEVHAREGELAPTRFAVCTAFGGAVLATEDC